MFLLDVHHELSLKVYLASIQVFHLLVQISYFVGLLLIEFHLFMQIVHHLSPLVYIFDTRLHFLYLRGRATPIRILH